MSFESILFAGERVVDARQADRDPVCFHDLNLDQFFDAVAAGKTDYDLRPFFRQSLATRDGIGFRQEVMRDLDEGSLFGIVERFGERMRRVRETLARGGKMYYELQKQNSVLEAVGLYCEAVRAAADEFGKATVSSVGFLAFRDYLTGYAVSDAFRALERSATDVAERLATIRYAVTIYGGSFKVRRYEEEQDYSQEILQVFEKFREAGSKNYLVELPDHSDMNHIEAKVLEFVAALNPDEFAALADLVRTHGEFQDATLVRFDREVQFYFAYLTVVRRLRALGCLFCYPEITEDKSVSATASFDIALAYRLSADKKPPVTNDFELTGGERIFVVSGPNQGGKTTFARSFGQLHVLANLGLPVPGEAARLMLFDEVFTHFERAEHVGDARGKLEDELLRVHDILERATSRSVVIMNEIFGSTTVRDATVLAERVLRRIIELDLLCVCVSFLDELASLGPSMVSMVSEVVPDQLTERTFKVRRRAPDGRSYAMALAEKYRLAGAPLAERLNRAA